MIVGGACRGFVRARSHAGRYAGVYGLVGFPQVLVIGFIWGDTEYGNMTALMLVAHVLSLILVWPAAIVANFAALRIFRPRSWRHEAWRAWVSGSLGAPFVWGGLAAWPHLARGSPELVNTLGQAFREIYFLSMVILFSNLAVLVGWILPPWKSRLSRDS